jgi:hypothetical protein
MRDCRSYLQKAEAVQSRVLRPRTRTMMFNDGICRHHGRRQPEPGCHSRTDRCRLCAGVEDAHATHAIQFKWNKQAIAERFNARNALERLMPWRLNVWAKARSIQGQPAVGHINIKVERQ